MARTADEIVALHTGRSATELDPSRTHLEILEDALSILKQHPPRAHVFRRSCDTGEVNCGVCGFPLTGHVRPGLEHATYRGDKLNPPCRWVRAVAELEAWIAVEEKLAQEQRARDESDYPVLRALSPTELEVLWRASRRVSGFVCPTPGLHGAAQTSVIEKLRADNFVTKDPAPTITEDGHTVLAFNRARESASRGRPV